MANLSLSTRSFCCRLKRKKWENNFNTSTATHSIQLCLFLSVQTEIFISAEAKQDSKKTERDKKRSGRVVGKEWKNWINGPIDRMKMRQSKLIINGESIWQIRERGRRKSEANEKKKPLSPHRCVFSVCVARQKKTIERPVKGASASAASALKDEHVCLDDFGLRFMCGQKMACKDAPIRQPRRQLYLSLWPN